MAAGFGLCDPKPGAGRAALRGRVSPAAGTIHRGLLDAAGFPIDIVQRYAHTVSRYGLNE